MKKVISFLILILFLASSIVNSSVCARYFISSLINDNCKVEIVDTSSGCRSCVGCGSQGQSVKEIKKCRAASFSYHSFNSTCSCIDKNINSFTAILEKRPYKTEINFEIFNHFEANYSIEYKLDIISYAPLIGVHHFISTTVLLC